LQKTQKRDEGFRRLRNPEGDIVKYNVYRDANMVPLKVGTKKMGT